MKKFFLIAIFLFSIIISAFIFPDKDIPPQLVYTPTAKITPEKIIEPTVIPTPQMADFNYDCEPAMYSTPSFSKSGNWMALRCIYRDEIGMVIVHKNGNKRFLKYLDFYPSQSREVEMYSTAGLNPVIWEDDEKSLYFAVTIMADGGDVCFYGSSDIGLYRISLDTGKTTGIFPVNDDYHSLLLYAFSPDARYLAYINYGNKDVPIIRNLKIGTEESIPIEGDAIGDLHWSPDGELLVFATCTIDPENDQERIAKVFKFTLADYETVQLYELIHGYLYVESFNSPDQLVLNLHGSETPKKVQINLKTNKVIESTPVE